MYLQTLTHSYRVLSARQGEPSVYLAEREGERYRILWYRGAQAEELLPAFLELEQADACTRDFVECSVQDGLLAVFRWHEGTPLLAKADGLSRRERLTLWRGLLERFLFERLPPALLCGAADPGCLVADDSLAVSVNHLPEPAVGEDWPAELQRRLSRVFFELFADELSAENDDFEEYGARLLRGAFLDGAAVYGSFLALLDEGEEPPEEKPLIRCWRRLFAHRKRLAYAVYVLAAAALWGLFAWALLRPAAALAEAERITEIGGLAISGEGIGGTSSDGTDQASPSGGADQDLPAGEPEEAKEPGEGSEPREGAESGAGNSSLEESGTEEETEGESGTESSDLG